MITYKTKLKSWGNSIGVVIPKNKIREEGLDLNDMIRVSVSPVKGLKASSLFGKISGLSGSTEEDLKEIDRELDSKL